MSPPLDSSFTPAEPVLLLKTKSTPTDAYEELFRSYRSPDASNTPRFDPRFIPVLEHRFDEPGLDTVRSILREGRVSSTQEGGFGGLIFTSQRAVEAFAEILREGAGW